MEEDTKSVQEMNPDYAYETAEMIVKFSDRVLTDLNETFFLNKKEFSKIFTETMSALSYVHKQVLDFFHEKHKVNRRVAAMMYCKELGKDYDFQIDENEFKS